MTRVLRSYYKELYGAISDDGIECPQGKESCKNKEPHWLEQGAVIINLDPVVPKGTRRPKLRDKHREHALLHSEYSVRRWQHRISQYGCVGCMAGEARLLFC